RYGYNQNINRDCTTLLSNYSSGKGKENTITTESSVSRQCCGCCTADTEGTLVSSSLSDYMVTTPGTYSITVKGGGGGGGTVRDVGNYQGGNGGYARAYCISLTAGTTINVYTATGGAPVSSTWSGWGGSGIGAKINNQWIVVAGGGGGAGSCYTSSCKPCPGGGGGGAPGGPGGTWSGYGTGGTGASLASLGSSGPATSYYTNPAKDGSNGGGGGGGSSIQKGGNGAGYCGVSNCTSNVGGGVAGNVGRTNGKTSAVPPQIEIRLQ
ncbi:MAG: hypothetical protein IKD08_05050, partial [Alphaproteobacteria bacterium]|nr:hypothetical protein [Alphaproteobacteria bacterium]